jgi:hypothetical protein
VWAEPFAAAGVRRGTVWAEPFAAGAEGRGGLSRSRRPHGAGPPDAPPYGPRHPRARVLFAQKPTSAGVLPAHKRLTGAYVRPALRPRATFAR